MTFPPSARGGSIYEIPVIPSRDPDPLLIILDPAQQFSGQLGIEL